MSFQWTDPIRSLREGGGERAAGLTGPLELLSTHFICDFCDRAYARQNKDLWLFLTADGELYF